MVHVPKADGTTRPCGDYAVTVKPQLHVPQYPIPLPEDVFLKLRGGQRFPKLDLMSAYQQLPLDPESQQFVTINTHRSLYRYKMLPFGIASSPALFQRTMDIILQGFDHVASIQDDILGRFPFRKKTRKFRWEQKWNFRLVKSCSIWS